MSRNLAEFEDYTVYFGVRLYPRVGNLALIGVGFVCLFLILDLAAVQDEGPLGLLLLHRALAVVFLAAGALVLRTHDRGYWPATAMLILGILSFLTLAVNYIVYTRHLEFLAFTLIFYLFGIFALAPLLRLRDYAVASVISLVVVGVLMEVPDFKTPDYAAAGLFAIPLQVFLGLAIALQQRASREQYEVARQNYLFSTLDTLSQLLNRRTWYLKTESQLKERRAETSGVAFLMLDIDHFKRFNDTWGHDCGDEVIRLVSALLVDQTREVDVVGRLGGEEFGILLPESDIEGARQTAERIRGAVAQARFRYREQDLEIHVSVGVAWTKSGSSDLDTLIKRGDLALYEAKRQGRNRVVVDKGE